MNTLGYLLLITALLFLAGFMLYARFATRTREVEAHHSPGEWLEPRRAAEGILPGVVEISETPSLRLDRNPIDSKRGEPGKAPEREYLDELQEAAAGLAMLMRSSPVGRTEPVIYEPEAEETEAEHLEELGAEAPAELARVEEVPEEVEFLEGHEEKEEELLISEETEEEGEWVAPRTWREILGEQVVERFDRVDLSLDALESLIGSIEVAMGSLFEGEGDEKGSRREEAPIAVAA